MDIKELKQELENTYKYRIEIHTHTSPVSPCSEISPEKTAEIYHQYGYHGIVVTNHFYNKIFAGMNKEEAIAFYMKDFYDTKKACEEYNIKTYFGIEISFKNENPNDFLIYGADENILRKSYDYLERTLSDFRKGVNLSGSLFIQAHPFRHTTGPCDVSLVDGIEAFNMHPLHNSASGLALKYAKDNNLNIITCGSDYHHLDRNHEAVSALRLKNLPEDSYEIAKILKSGDYVLELGGQSIVLP